MMMNDTDFFGFKHSLPAFSGRRRMKNIVEIQGKGEIEYIANKEECKDIQCFLKLSEINILKRYSREGIDGVNGGVGR